MVFIAKVHSDDRYVHGFSGHGVRAMGQVSLRVCRLREQVATGHYKRGRSSVHWALIWPDFHQGNFAVATTNEKCSAEYFHLAINTL